MSLPKVVRVQQNFNATHITNIPKAVAEQIGKLGLQGRLKPGQTVAITGGSRGVAPGRSNSLGRIVGRRDTTPHEQRRAHRARR